MFEDIDFLAVEQIFIPSTCDLDSSGQFIRDSFQLQMKTRLKELISRTHERKLGPFSGANEEVAKNAKASPDVGQVTHKPPART